MARADCPTPDGLPIIGHTHRFASDMAGFYEEAASLGPIVKIEILGMGDVYILSEPEDVKQVLVTDRDDFSRPERIWSLLSEDLLGDGLVPSNDESWRRSRDIVGPAFQPSEFDSYGSQVTDIAERMASSWEPGQRYDMHEQIKEVTRRILVEWLFGPEVDYEGLRLPEMLDNIEEPRKKMPLAQSVPKWVPIPMWRRYKSAVDHFGQIVPELIRAERRADDDRETLLSSFLQAGSGTGNPVTNEEARDEVMSLLFAGYETTAATLIYALYLLDDNPRVAERFYDEVDTVLDGRTPTAEDVPDLEYVQAVISETWRLYPPVPRFTSEATTDVDVDGYRIPEGSLVEAPQWLLHRDERFWDDPLEFRPERWFEDSDRPEFAYFPFGGGKRRCVGSSFARMETVLALAAISNTRRFRFDADELSVSFGFVIVPENSFEAVVERR